MPAPDAYVEHRIVIVWVVGDSLVVDPGGLEDWEVRAALDKAMDLMSDDTEDAEVEDDSETA